MKPYPKRHQRKGDDIDTSAVKGDLNWWGPRYRRILLSEGYSSFSPFAGLLEGRVDVFAARILIPDMDARAWEVNFRVWALPTDLAWALVGRYSVPVRDKDGSLFTSKELGAALGITEELFRQRVCRGIERLRSAKSFTLSQFTPILDHAG
jgi:hypothetical protein